MSILRPIASSARSAGPLLGREEREWTIFDDAATLGQHLDRTTVKRIDGNPGTSATREGACGRQIQRLGTRDACQRDVGGGHIESPPHASPTRAARASPPNYDAAKNRHHHLYINGRARTHRPEGLNRPRECRRARYRRRYRCRERARRRAVGSRTMPTPTDCSHHGAALRTLGRRHLLPPS